MMIISLAREIMIIS